MASHHVILKAVPLLIDVSPSQMLPSQTKLQEALGRGETLSDGETIIANASWADIKHDPVASRPFVDAAHDDRARVTAAVDEKLFKIAQGASDRGIFRGKADKPGTFRVDASVSEVPGDFRMKIDDKPGGGGRSCKTKVEVLETGTYRGQPVTKLLLRSVLGI